MEPLRKLLPVLTTSMRKGSCGRIGVIGGSLEYTGAPYFAAISAMKLGGDLCHVFCTESAAPVIKGYSPSLIVHPGWDPEGVVDGLSRMDCLVLGPGLGRESSTEDLFVAVLKYAADSGKPIVIDGDAIYWYCRMGGPIGLKNAIFTPNRMEMDRLTHAFVGSHSIEVTNEDLLTSMVRETAATLESNVYMKGEVDIFSTYDAHVSYGRTQGGLRRCGGQGDLTAGTLSLLAFWAKKTPGCTYVDAFDAASDLVRTASRKAFEQIGRSMETTDVIDQIASMLREIDNR